MLAALALVAVAVYAGITAALWLLQEKLLFYPVPAVVAARAPEGWSLEAVEISAADGTRLSGVLVKPPGPPAPLLVYYGGNAEEVTAWAPEAAAYGARAQLLVNYRGYGKSEGTPSERALVGDALEVLDWCLRRTDIDAARVVLVGRSLGSGVAVQVAAARPATAVVLVSPYDSVTDVAAAAYSWLPVRWLVRHPFDSASRAPGIRIPALVVTGTEDTVIPPAHSKRLADLWGGPVERAILAGRGHGDLVGPEYQGAIRGFLDRHL